jgi:hypothetical protein
MPENKQLLKFIWALLGLCFSMSAVAAQTVFVTDLSVIPLGSVGLAAVIGGLGGLGSTLSKISNKRLEVDNLWLVILIDTAIGIIVGLAAFFAAAASHQEPFPAALAIFGTGWAGAFGLKRIFPVGISEVQTRATDPTAPVAVDPPQ